MEWRKSVHGDRRPSCVRDCANCRGNRGAPLCSNGRMKKGRDYRLICPLCTPPKGAHRAGGDAKPPRKSRAVQRTQPLSTPLFASPLVSASQTKETLSPPQVILSSHEINRHISNPWRFECIARKVVILDQNQLKSCYQSVLTAYFHPTVFILLV